MDSYVLETDVHFPTDINLLWDSGRKCLDMIRHLSKALDGLPQWRQQKKWHQKFRRHYRRSAEIHRKKGANYKPRLQQAIKDYLGCSRQLRKKINRTLEEEVLRITQGEVSIKVFALLEALQHYLKLLDKHIELVDRRILKGEKIPHGEKLFSIFEQHTRWINKGKLHKKVELGLPILIATDQYQFIVHHQVMEQGTDVELTQPTGQAIAGKFEKTAYELASISFDRSFYSLPAKQALEKLFTRAVLPKPGKKTPAQQAEETQPQYIKLRKTHSTVEANINQLEHNGLNRCPDKGARGFRRYVALGVLAYNLQHLGKLLIEMRQEQQPKAQCRRA